MSNERPVEGQTATLTEEQIRKSMSREEKKARAVRILERGMVNDRTTVENLPPHLHGEWVPRDAIEIDRKAALGFWIDHEYAPRRSLHSAGTGESIVGDTVYMVCLKEDKEIIDEVRYEQYIRMHGTKEQRKQLGINDLSTREEREFKTQALASDNPVIEESTLDPAVVANKERLTAALAATGEHIDKS
jgi:hypothetical protein